MDSITILMTKPILPYLQQELDSRFTVLKLWETPPNTTTAQFLQQHSDAIRAVVVDGSAGLTQELMTALPKMEIVASSSVGMDKIDLGKCREKGIRVTNTPDVLTDDVADLAIGLILAVLRNLPACDRYVRSGLWVKGEFKLGTKMAPTRRRNSQEVKGSVRRTARRPIGEKTAKTVRRVYHTTRVDL